MRLGTPECGDEVDACSRTQVSAPTGPCHFPLPPQPAERLSSETGCFLPGRARGFGIKPGQPPAVGGSASPGGRASAQAPEVGLWASAFAHWPLLSTMSSIRAIRNPGRWAWHSRWHPLAFHFLVLLSGSCLRASCLAVATLVALHLEVIPVERPFLGWVSVCSARPDLDSTRSVSNPLSEGPFPAGGLRPIFSPRPKALCGLSASAPWRHLVCET